MRVVYSDCQGEGHAHTGEQVGQQMTGEERDDKCMSNPQALKNMATQQESPWLVKTNPNPRGEKTNSDEGELLWVATNCINHSIAQIIAHAGGCQLHLKHKPPAEQRLYVFVHSYVCVCVSLSLCLCVFVCLCLTQHKGICDER